VSVKAVTLVLLAGAIGSALLAFNFLNPPEDPPATARPMVPAPSPEVRAKETLQGGPAEAGSRPQPVQAPHAQPQLSTPGPKARVSGGTAQGAPSTSSDPAEAERVFAAETADPAWSPGMEATIYEQIGDIAGPELVTVHTECRTTLCRLEVTQRVPVQAGRSADESPEMYDMYETLFARLGFESRPVTSTADGKGIVTSVVYLPRGDLAPSDR
jgi:hypothetical protein